MTDEIQPGSEERLPATRPPEQLVAERFTAAPPVRATDGLTPERSAAALERVLVEAGLVARGAVVVFINVSPELNRPDANFLNVQKVT